MNKFSKYLLSNICVALIIGFLFNSPTTYGGYGGKNGELGLTLMLLALGFLLLGIIISIVVKEKSFGLSMLAAAGLLLLIGFGVCTILA